MEAAGLLENYIVACLLLSLRFLPLFLFAPPFSLMRIPRMATVIITFGFAAAMVGANPQLTQLEELSRSWIVISAAKEIFFGFIPVIVLQIMFGSLYMVGRTIDIQAGFGLALLIDPTSRGQRPLFGTIFAYGAAAIFFAVNGHHDLLRFFALSIDLVPLGSGTLGSSITPLLNYIFICFFLALGIGGAVIFALFITDLLVAMLSRTVPQMNALLLGIQVKAILVLFVTPISLGLSGAVFLRLISNAIGVMPKLM
ncbi:flagellar biosynthetic protein FliR [Sphingorhabdus arenilitoris]|uniref:Flagellar biosynthetic protein FliR n=1 Tax=Sphingorhabdus arenilitoris TaxID=1490041 RepID=A0ABV8RF44_9SPHN